MRLYLRHSVARVLAGHLPSPATMVGYFGFAFPGVWVKYKDLLCAHCWKYNLNIVNVGVPQQEKHNSSVVRRISIELVLAQRQRHASGGLDWPSVIHTGRRRRQQLQELDGHVCNSVTIWVSTLAVPHSQPVNCPKVWGHAVQRAFQPRRWNRNQRVVQLASKTLRSCRPAQFGSERQRWKLCNVGQFYFSEESFWRVERALVDLSAKYTCRLLPHRLL